MEVNSVLEGITEYFLKCPLLKDGVFRVDALGPDPVEYTIETGIFDPVIQRYVDGSSERQYQFQFGSSGVLQHGPGTEHREQHVL
ncbi:MAG: hypothetical protein ACLR4N_02270 [Mediterraneibacter faecis]